LLLTSALTSACTRHYAREAITEVIEKIKKSNKHIKIAVGNDGGWETVRQYQSNPVASDSDDETKITKAEKRTWLVWE
jgi:hypothetical protein